jgi:dTDP-4-dehydrorhamnose reductase
VAEVLDGPVVVTGAGGLLGGQVAWTFAQKGIDVYAFTHKQLDITDAKLIGDAVANVNAALVVNCAAMTNVDACELEPGAAFAINSEGAANVAQAAADAGAEVVHISTDYVFDGERGSYTEDDETNPIQVYGRSKAQGDDRVREATALHYVLRSAWIYGPGGKNFLSALPVLAETNASISAVIDQFGSPTYAPDLADAIVKLAGSRKYGTYHVVNDGRCSFAEFCELAVGLMGADLEVKHTTLESLGRPAPRPRDASLLSVGWVKAGFEPLRHWEDAARAFLEQVPTP